MFFFKMYNIEKGNERIEMSAGCVCEVNFALNESGSRASRGDALVEALQSLMGLIASSFRTGSMHH